ncbi:cyclase [Geomonas silvestris]|uniref:Kynurenine formamidase n=1 Tax=Geomonas silvestris TaxID=2740184 RepID=A0A6V8MGY8_9BACT|nr:cyclase family protein [Geomonas silvestris]GFO59246.1 cyclase [Geomonas silvestris]
MRIYDITLPLSSQLPVYPGDCGFELSPWNRIANGDEANVSRLSFCNHAGTHLDPPRHFDDAGATIDEIPLERLVGRALVLELEETKVIGRKELHRLPVRGVERLLLKTGNSRLWQESGFSPDFAALSVDGAQYLVEAGVKLVGIDYLSIEGMDGDGTVHRTLLKNDVLVVEGLNLEGIDPGEYELICLPLKVKGGDGAPVRALLRGSAAGGGLAFDPHTTKWPVS